MIPLISFATSISLVVLFIKNRTKLSNFCSELQSFTPAFLRKDDGITQIGLGARAGAWKKLKIAYGLSIIQISVNIFFFYKVAYLETSNKLMGGICVGLIPLATFFTFFSTTQASFLFSFTFFMKYMTGMFRAFAKVFQEEEENDGEQTGGIEIVSKGQDHVISGGGFFRLNAVRPVHSATTNQKVI